MPDLSKFMKYAQSIVNDVLHLRIVTAVGEFSVSKEDDQWKIDPATRDNSAILTDINIVQGDVVNLIPKEFAAESSPVRDFHSAQVEKAENIVRANIAALKGMLEVLVMANDQNAGPPESASDSTG